MGSRNRAVGSQWLVLDLPSLLHLSGKLRWCFPSCFSFTLTFPSEHFQVVRRPMVMEAKQEEVRLDITALSRIHYLSNSIKPKRILRRQCCLVRLDKTARLMIRLLFGFIKLNAIKVRVDGRTDVSASSEATVTVIHFNNKKGKHLKNMKFLKIPLRTTKSLSSSGNLQQTEQIRQHTFDCINP